MSSAGGKKRKTAASGVASKGVRDNRPVGDENCSGTGNRVVEPEQQMIDYTPHYEVLVKEGATHFDSVSAAIFEHIDNSITAFQILPPEHERKIEVQIHVPAKGLYDAEPIYLAIWDNAGGMTTKQLEAYFTAALGRETRGLEPKGKGEATARRAHLAGNLSKFGVGALQSFAYLGTQLKVITKDKQEGKVRYYKIDKDYFKQKEESHGRDSVFKGAVRVVETAEKALEEDEGGAEDRGTGVVEPVVDVRWMARKLPNAMYQRLYFFPAEKKTAANKAELELCGKQWQERVHVTLFIKDWYFG
eukprot:evm.model.NODE_5343_length_5450_cov_21.959082.2